MLNHVNTSCIKIASLTCNKFGRLPIHFNGVVCRFSTGDLQEKARKSEMVKRSIGQPTAHTHPFLMKEGEVTPGLNKQDYAERRNLLMKTLSEVSDKENKENLVILFGEPITYMSEDIPYPFHQNTNFRYLTGFLEPGSCLIMESLPGGSSCDHKSMLLVPERDPHKELWHGSRAGTDGALEHTGVDSTDVISKLAEVTKSFLSDKYNVWYDFQKATNMQLHMQHMRPFLTEAYNKKIKIRPVNDVIHQHRLIKSDKEVLLMLEAATITSEAFKRALPASYPGMNESTIQAMIDCECRFKGAQMLAYPPVVAGGTRANTLHYIFNDQLIKNGDLVLVDAGAEYHGYVADITRTWPINGKFTPAQRSIYDSVLKVQRLCIDLCRPGTSLDQIYSTMALMITQELIQKGVINEKVKGQDVHEVARKYCPHHISHWLGMDVHDTQCIPRSMSLQPGMAVTVEPGIYIREDDLSVTEEYRGIGIRIEDDVVVTTQNPIVLTRACPKDADEIESLMSSR